MTTPHNQNDLEHSTQFFQASTGACERKRTGSGSGGLEVRCPSCHAPTIVAVDTSLTDIICGNCGSHFSLVDQSKATHIAPSLTQLGRFELIERLGVGGFGSVWKARDKELDRTVAIKIPRAGGMTAEEQEKFFREARAAAQLRHPNIVSVHEVGRDADSVYIVSDFVRGVTLGDWLTGQKLTSREAAELTATIGDALHHAHEQGVVHRDLKPANIMIGGDGQPHLMDFGLARREVGEVTVTMDGHVLGTPAYMSPEQAEGKAHTADRRSDIYSLGVILFELLTGELPFRGNARMLMHQVIHDEPPSPRKLNANVPKDLETITLRCLEKDAIKRYSSAFEVAEELRRWLSGRPIHARPINWAGRARRWISREPVVATFAFVCVGLLLSIAIGASYSALMFRRQLQREAALRELATRSSQAANRAYSESERMNGFLLSALSWGNRHPGATVRESLIGTIAETNARLDSSSAAGASVNQMIGQLYLDLGMLPEAEVHLTKARNTIGRGAISGTTKWHVLHSLGWLRFRQKRISEARDLLTEAMDLAPEPDNPYPLGTGRLVAELSVVLEHTDDEGMQQSDRLLRSAEAQYRRMLPETRGDLCHILSVLGCHLMLRKEYDDSIKILTETINTSGSDIFPPTYLPYAHLNLSLSLRGEGRLDEAIYHQQKAVDSFAALFGRDHEETRGAEKGYEQLLKLKTEKR